MTNLEHVRAAFPDVRVEGFSTHEFFLQVTADQSIEVFAPAGGTTFWSCQTTYLRRFLLGQGVSAEAARDALRAQLAARNKEVLGCLF